jgi:NADH dehydrogenase/NADH:ubiquinone oxidoreductase subunit G
LCDISLQSDESYGGALGAVRSKLRGYGFGTLRTDAAVKEMFERGAAMPTALYRWEEFEAKLTAADALWPTAPYARAEGARRRVRFRNKMSCTVAELETKMEEAAAAYRASEAERKKKFEGELEEKKRKNAEKEEAERKASELRRAQEEERQRKEAAAAEKRQRKEAAAAEKRQRKKAAAAAAAKEAAAAKAAKKAELKAQQRQKKQKNAKEKQSMTQVIKSNDKKPLTRNIIPSVNGKCSQCGNSVSKKCATSLCRPCCLKVPGVCRFHKKN